MKYHKGGSEYEPQHVGTGVTFILFQILALLILPEETVVIIENPEIHLHPSLQSNLMYFYQWVSESKRQLFIETHSDHIFNVAKYFKMTNLDCTILFANLEKVGIGVALFMGAYVSNMCLGAWRNVKIEGYDFDWKLILQSLVKFIVLGLGISIMSIVVSILPVYMEYVGIDVADETMQVLDSLVIITAFVVACVKYVKEAYEKLKDILSV